MSEPDARQQALYDRIATEAKVVSGIGLFIFQFSQLEFSIRVVLASLLNLKDEQFDIITSPYDFATLCRVTKEIMIQQRPSPHQERDIEVLFSGCLKLNEERVRVAHGLWAGGDKGITARHVARNSLKAAYFYDNPDELIKHAATASRLMAEILEATRAFPKIKD